VRPLRIVAVAAVLPAVLLGAAGCSGSGDEPAAPPSTVPASDAAGENPAPTLAGPAEAEALAALPAGPATGTAVLAYSGVGEVREPFTGECSHTGDTTRIEGSADTARITLDVAPDGARLTLDDLGLSATSELSTGRYEVSGGHLSLAAQLTSDGQPAGSVTLELDCGD
jgi:hypothetical protein